MEGIKLQPYLDACGYVTCGVGHLLYLPNGEKMTKLSDVPPRFQGLTKDQVVELLQDDLVQFEDDLNSLPLTFEQHQFDALIDFTFNLGFGALQNSTLLKSMKGEDLTPIEDCFMMYDKIRVDTKLVVSSWQQARRKTESLLYTTGELKFFA